MIKKETIKTIDSSYVKIPLIGTIVFSLLLAFSSFFAGAAWIKIKGGETSNLTSKNIFAAEKVDKPQLDFYVMSFCPYGDQMEDILRPVFDLLGDKVDIRPRYIFDKISNLSEYCKLRSGDPTQCSTYIQAGYFQNESDCKKAISDNSNRCLDQKNYLKIGDNFYSSLHGRVEANQNVREICAYNLAEDKKLWWDFVNNVNTSCNDQNADSCWQEQAQKAGLDTNKITECFNKEAASLIEKEIADTSKYQIQGSPTLMIGELQFPPQIDPEATDQNIKIGREVFSLNQTREPNVIKEAVCSAFKKTPKECKTVLETPQAADGSAAPAQGGC